MPRSVFGMIAALVIILAACATQQTTPIPAPPTATEQTTIRIGVVINNEIVDDGGFNELTYAGVELAAGRFGATVNLSPSTSEEDYAPLITAYAGDGYDIIVTVGFVMGDTTLAAAAEYPDTHFIGIDQFQAEPIDNVTGIIFPDDEAGYLAGVLAANLSESGIVAGIYGPDVVLPVLAFARGFEAGAISVNPDIEVMTTFHPGTVADGFGDLEWGADTAQIALDAGADVVFTAAGDTGRGALVQVSNAVDADNKLYCIGVDTDQWLTVRESRRCLVSSAVKSIAPAVNDVIGEVLTGNPPSGNFLGPVGLASFHEFEDIIPEELQAEIIRITGAFQSGDLETGITLE